MRSLFLSVLAIAIVGCNRTTPPADSPTSEPAPKPDSRLMIAPVPEADPYLRLLDVDAIVFKYSGGLIDCWLEETIGDQPPVASSTLAPSSEGPLQCAKLNKDHAKAGFVVVTRRKLGEKELWDLKLAVDRPDQGQVGVKLTGATVLTGGGDREVTIQGFSILKQPQEFAGETTLITAGNSIATVRLKCTPMKGDAQ